MFSRKELAGDYVKHNPSIIYSISYITSDLQLGSVEMLHRPEHHSIDHLRERGVADIPPLEEERGLVDMPPSEEE